MRKAALQILLSLFLNSMEYLTRSQSPHTVLAGGPEDPPEQENGNVLQCARGTALCHSNTSDRAPVHHGTGIQILVTHCSPLVNPSVVTGHRTPLCLEQFSSPLDSAGEINPPPAASATSVRAAAVKPQLDTAGKGRASQ